MTCEKTKTDTIHFIRICSLSFNSCQNHNIMYQLSTKTKNKKKVSSKYIEENPQKRIIIIDCHHYFSSCVSNI